MAEQPERGGIRWVGPDEVEIVRGQLDFGMMYWAERIPWWRPIARRRALCVAQRRVQAWADEMFNVTEA